MILSSSIKNFIEHLKLKNFSLLTLKNYNHYLARFLEFAGDIEIIDINQPLINRYKKHLSESSDQKTGIIFKKSTQNYHLIALRGFLQFLQLQNILVELNSEEKRQVELLNLSAARRIIESTNLSKKEGIRDRAIMETIFCTGLLVSHLVRLNIADVNLEEENIKVSNKEKVYPLSEEAVNSLKTYLLGRKDIYPPLFIRYHGDADPIKNGEDMRLTPRSIERIVKKYGSTPQALRQSLAANLLTTGEDVHSVADLLGHKNISTTQAYHPSSRAGSRDL